MPSDAPIKPGDKLWFVPKDHWAGPNRFVEVEKVGRKWGYFPRNYRFDVNTLDVDGRGYSVPGHLYRDRDAWEARRRADYAWDRVTWHIRNRTGRKDGITEADIRQAAALLGIEIEDAP